MSEIQKPVSYQDVAKPVWDLMELMVGKPSDLPEGHPFIRTEAIGYDEIGDASDMFPVSGLVRVSEAFVPSPDQEGELIRGLCMEILMRDDRYEEGISGVDSLRFFHSKTTGLVRLVTLTQPLTDDPKRMAYEAEFLSRIRL